MHEKNSVVVEFSKDPCVADRKLTDKLTIYFQKQQVSGGCDVSKIQLDRADSKLTALVIFEEYEAVETVLSRKNHVFDIDGQNIHIHVEPFTNYEVQKSVKMATDEYSFDSFSDMQLHSMNSIDSPALYPEVHSDEDLYSSSMGTNPTSSKDLNPELHQAQSQSPGQSVATSYKLSPSRPTHSSETQGARCKIADDSDPMEWESFPKRLRPSDETSTKRPGSDHGENLLRNEHLQTYGDDLSKTKMQFGGNSSASCRSKQLRHEEHNKLNTEHASDKDLDKGSREPSQVYTRKQQFSSANINVPKTKNHGSNLRNVGEPSRHSRGDDGLARNTSGSKSKRHGYDLRNVGEPSRHSRGDDGFAKNTSGSKSDYQENLPTGHQVLHDQHPCQQNRQSEPGPSNESISSEEDSEDDDLPSTTVQVSNLKPSITREMLELHFESKRHGGGPILNLTLYNGSATITFEDPKVASSVASRPHKIEKADVTVVLVKRKKPRKRRPIDRHRLILTDIPDGTTEETLSLFIEGRTKIDEDPDILYGEIPGTAMVIYSEEIKDLEKILGKFKERKLSKQIVSAYSMEYPDCILVQNLSPSITEDALELYFESERKSGGGIVRELKMDEKRQRAYVFFKDWKVVDRVVGRQHSLSKTSLHVSPLFDKLGAIVTSDRPTPHIPDPVTVKVDPSIAEFVLDAKGQHRSLVDSDILDEHGRLSWPSKGQNNLVEISPVTTGDANCWLDWSQRVTSRLNDIMSKFKSVYLNVEGDLWNEVCSRLQQLNLGNVQPLLKSDRTTIVLRGPCQEVDSTMTRVSDVVKSLQEEAERARQITQQKIKLGEDRLKYFYQCNIKEDLDNKWQVDVKILTSDNPHEVIFEGMRSAVTDVIVEMYTHLENLMKHDFEFSPNKIRFVKHVQDKVHEILTSRNVHAAISIDGNKVTVTASKEKDIRQTFHFIQNDITEDTVPIKNQPTVNVLQTEKGRKCLMDINNTKAVLASVNQERNCIELTGFKVNVQQATNKITAFIENNAVLEEHVPLIRGKVKYLMEYSSSELQSIREHNKQYTVDMKLVPGGAKSGITISGTEHGLKLAVNSVKALGTKIVDRQYPVAKPGMPELLKGVKGKKLLGNISKDLSCFIDSNSDSYAGGEVAAAVGTAVEELRRHTTDNGVHLVVCNGDLTMEKVDAIVNAANVELKHIGGLAGAILKRGGESIKTESREVIAKNGGPLQVAQAEFTGPGTLPCQHIIHVAGPKWERGPPIRDEGPTEEEDLLFDSVRNVLRAASRKNLKSISIPALSSGVYGFPIDLCAQTVVDAAVEFCRKRTSLKEIRFTNIDKRACDAFMKVFSQQFGDERDNPGRLDFGGFTDRDDFGSMGGAASMDFSSPGPSFASPQPTLASMVTLASRDTLSTREQKTITLKRGDIAAENVNIIVNTTGSGMNLRSGGVSNAILAVGGPALQQNCQQVMAQQGLSNVNPGDFIETGPANLNCQRVYHCVGTSYNGPTSEALLRSLMQKILQQADQSGSQSIAIPAIGTGTLAYPHDVVAEIMYDEAITFSKQNPAGSLTDIRFVVYHRDQPTIKAFEDEMQKLIQGKQGSAVPMQPNAAPVPTRRLKTSKGPGKPARTPVPGDEKAFGTVTNHRDGSSSIQIGHITVQLQEGDLTKENTDAIVNSAGNDLSLNGPMSRAILKAGGKQIETECEQLVQKGDKNLKKGAVKTTAGRLPCKCIIHVVTPHSGAQLKSVALKALQLAENDGMLSIAFPALGTGNVGGNAATAASVLLDAIGEFAASTGKNTLRIVKLTIFQKQMLPDFIAALLGKEHVSYKPQKSILRRGLDYVVSRLPVFGADDGEMIEGDDNVRTENKPETLILRIFAGDVATIDKAVERIEEFIQDEFCREELSYQEEMWGELDNSKMNDILDIGENNNVKITPMLGRAKRIIIEGRALNVQKAKGDIQEMFTKIHMAKKKETEDQLFNKEVQWRYKDSTGVFIDYGDEINPIIERAFRKKQPHVDLDLIDGLVRIDFFVMEEKQRGAGGKVKTAVHRADLKKEHQGSFTLPSSWIPMTNQNSVTSALTQGSAEFKQVQTTFQNSLGRVPQIHKIERVQIVDLYKSYVAKMDKIKTTLPAGMQVERTLFHGTSHDSCDKINKHGFNRSYCGKNGTAHGNGTYFAKDASYSDGYAAQSGTRNQKHMYMAKVLTGEYTQGKAGMISPPPKQNNPNEIYDSVVNSMTNPGVFVIFHDSQAYPEYLISYN